MYVITGGGSGIGKALALALVKRGKKVLIAGRREFLLKETAALSPQIEYLCVDISTEEGRFQVFEKLKQESALHALVNNAGIIEPMVSLENIGMEDWRQIMATNVEAPLFLTQRLTPLLNGGRVLNIGSGAAYRAVVGIGAYCVSKAALHMLTRCFQAESTKKLNFASVMPGITDTDMQGLLRVSDALSRDTHDFYNHLKKKQALISTETVAAFLCWLLLDISDEEYIASEWDIYDASHHEKWLKPPHAVPGRA